MCQHSSCKGKTTKSFRTKAPLCSRSSYGMLTTYAETIDKDLLEFIKRESRPAPICSCLGTFVRQNRYARG
jgi:hypothetical protein